MQPNKLRFNMGQPFVRLVGNLTELDRPNLIFYQFGGDPS